MQVRTAAHSRNERDFDLTLLILGDATLHAGRTLHYAFGNTTDQPRRGYIVNCRPASMVKFERDNNYDHGKAGINKMKDIRGTKE